MTWRSFTMLALAGCCVALTIDPFGKAVAQDDSSDKAAADTPAVIDGVSAPEAAPLPIQYLPLGAPAGMSQAVIVPRMPLVHTRQLFPFDRDGKLVGIGSADQQIEQVLDNLDAVLKDSGSGLDKLIRLNIYALSTATVSSVREQLSKRLDPSVRPVITSILTPLAHRQTLVAVDAVAGADNRGEAVALRRCESVAGDDQRADAAVLPPGGIAYLAGQPEQGDLTMLPTTMSMTSLMTTLGHLKLSPEHIVQLKVFLRPATSAEQVLGEIQAFFPDQIMPPVVFVEWLASVPLEIEMIAQLPLPERQTERVEYFTPPEVRPSNTFSRVALVDAERQIYISGLFAQKPSRGEPQAEDVFGQLKRILSETGSDMRHLVKATYYVSDDDAARWIDRLRPRLYDPERPPSASKLMVHGVGQAQRTMTVDMIAVESE